MGRVVAVAVIGAALLVGCGAAPQGKSSMSAIRGDAASNAPMVQSEVMSGEFEAGASEAGAAAFTPQLIRRAQISLEVDDATASVKAIQTLVRQQQGNILQLREKTLPGDGSPRRASLELRVPQERLDATLEELSNLGLVENRSITAEDVSSQMVDTSARLRNLRKQEEMVLGIMERSGEISEVLEVSNQLATVRQSIEQLDAQLQLLKTQVAYSTISLELAEPLAAGASRRSLGSEMKSAWNGASNSVGAFSRGWLVVGLWLLAYSPYLGAIAAMIYVVRRSRRRSVPTPPPSPTPTS